MVRRPLGKTGLQVTPIGFGAFKVGRNQGAKYPAKYPVPTDEDAESLLNGVLDMGINYIDTAPAYGLSEERIGRFLAHRRSEFVLSTKVGETFEDGRSTYDFSRRAVLESITQSCRRLRTDTLDLVFIHSNGRDAEIMKGTDVVETLINARDRGQIRAAGLSGKTVEGALAALVWADAIMVEYNTDDTSHAEVMQRARERGTGVVVKKGLASGTLEAGVAVRFVLRHPAVNSLVIGGLDIDHLRENVRAASALASVE